DLNGNSDTIGALTVQTGTATAATVLQGGATLTLTGNLYVGISGTGAIGVTLPGAVNFSISPREINVADTTAASDLVLGGVIGGAAATTLTKQNAGAAVLAGGVTETYQGATAVNQGALFVDATT